MDVKTVMQINAYGYHQNESVPRHHPVFVFQMSVADSDLLDGADSMATALTDSRCPPMTSKFILYRTSTCKMARSTKTREVWRVPTGVHVRSDGFESHHLYKSYGGCG